MSNPIIRIDGITKRFGIDVTAVDNVSIDVGEGEFFALLGPSGCGKTTLLRMIAGFETPSEGRLLIDGEEMSGVSPNRRPVNMVFQSYAVFPHMSVARNVGYGLRLERLSGAEIETRVNEALDLVQLGGYGARMPDQLSGGQRQRVALARALVKRPRVLLLDEPLSALDAKLREAMQLELVRLQQTVGITFVIVTHDQDEALGMADRIAVMEQGKVRQLATPHNLYEYPASRFVADFIGKMNLFDGVVQNDHVDVPGIGQVLFSSRPDTTIINRLTAGMNIGVAIRPEKIRLALDNPGTMEGGVVVPATVAATSYHGNETHVYADSNGPDGAGHRLSATVQNLSRDTGTIFKVGTPVFLIWRQDDMLLLPD